MRYALIRQMDISNGKGVGISLFVQGCHFHCKDVLIQKHGTLMRAKNGLKRLKINLLN